MRRNLLVAVLALGAVLGLGSGFAHLHHRCRHGFRGSCCVHGPRDPGSPPPASP